MSVEFRLECTPSPFAKKISIDHRILLLGSCFTSHLHDKLESHKFCVEQNPHGILFNPISIFNTIRRYISGNSIDETSLFFHQGLWNHWDFHSSCSDAEKKRALEIMNTQIRLGHNFLKSADWLFLTLGSGFVYEHPSAGIVANCHKYPTDQFKRYLLDPLFIKDTFIDLSNELKSINEKLNIVLTVSPVRHLRDGYIENNRSKAVLFHAIDQIVGVLPEVVYFPAYELIIDDLRDYRFYAEDMVHPNYMATQYVWEKFVSAAVDGKSQEVMKEIQQLQQAVKHRPLHPSSQEHIKFRKKYLEQAIQLSRRFPSIDFSNEIAFFS